MGVYIYYFIRFSHQFSNTFGEAFGRKTSARERCAISASWPYKFLKTVGIQKLCEVAASGCTNVTSKT